MNAVLFILLSGTDYRRNFILLVIIFKSFSLPIRFHYSNIISWPLRHLEQKWCLKYLKNLFPYLNLPTATVNRYVGIGRVGSKVQIVNPVFQDWFSLLVFDRATYSFPAKSPLSQSSSLKTALSDGSSKQGSNSRAWLASKSEFM